MNMHKRMHPGHEKAAKAVAAFKGVQSIHNQPVDHKPPGHNTTSIVYVEVKEPVHHDLHALVKVEKTVQQDLRALVTVEESVQQDLHAIVTVEEPVKGSSVPTSKASRPSAAHSSTADIC